MAELNGLENERLQIIQLLNGEDIATEETAQAVPEPQVRSSVRVLCVFVCTRVCVCACVCVQRGEWVGGGWRWGDVCSGAALPPPVCAAEACRAGDYTAGAEGGHPWGRGAVRQLCVRSPLNPAESWFQRAVQYWNPVQIWLLIKRL